MRAYRLTAMSAVSAVLVCLLNCSPQSMNPLPASLQPGSYEGNIQSTTRVYLDGVQIGQPVQSVQRIQETIGSTGYPLLSTGEPVRADDAIVLAEAGDNLLVGTVTSVVRQPDGLVLHYNLDGEVDGILVTGVGQTTYEPRDNGSLTFNLDLDFAGVDEDGNVIRQTEERSGILTPVSN